MKRRYHLPVLVCFLLYFLHFLTGAPQEYAPQQEFFFFSDETPAFERTWQPGLYERLELSRRAVTLFSDPLLESDSRPDNLLRALDRSLAGDTFLFTLTLGWVALLLLTMLAMLRRHWFYQPLLQMVLTPSLVVLLFVLLTVRREAMLFSGSFFSLYYIFIESGLFFAGTALLFRSLQPTATLPGERPFMEHLRQRRGSLSQSILSLVIATIEVTAIALVALLLSNIILLPLYQAQISFPSIFAGIIAAGLVMLALFYITAYLRVSRFQKESSSPFSSLAFLGFRFMSNTIFLGGIVGLVALIVALIIIVSMFNIGFLQSVELLQKPTSM